MDFLYFVLLTSTLIFVHEFGHFLFAKLFHVKVLTFSIGFGPKVFRFRGTETEYCVGLLPFGGFVSMLEQSKNERPLPPEDLARSFEAQARWKRVLIVLAGPLMNLLFPLGLYCAVFLDDTRVHPAVIGAVTPGYPAEGKLFPGDKLLRVGGKDVTTFSDVQRIVGRSPGVALSFEVEREGKETSVEIFSREEIEDRGLGVLERSGRIGIAPNGLAPVIAVLREDTPAYRAGLRSFDRIAMIGSVRIETFGDLVHALSKNKGETVVALVLRPEVHRNKLFDVGILEPHIVSLTPLERAPLAKVETFDEREADLRTRVGIETSDRYVAFIPEGSSEWRAGLRPGDRIEAIDGTPVRSWAEFRLSLSSRPAHVRELVWTRNGVSLKGSFQLRRERWTDSVGQKYERFVFRSSNDAPIVDAPRIDQPYRVFSSLVRATEETYRVLRFVVLGLVKLVKGELSLRTVSGVVTLYDVAGEAGSQGVKAFVFTMAVISINLGVFNLLPIPILDGGHLFVLAIETVRRKALEVRTRQIANLVGVAVLAFLMILSFRNDLGRKWPEIVGSFREWTK